MARQLSLDLRQAAAAGPGTFFVTEATAAAHDAVMGDVIWPGGRLVLTGPAGSGKTHLLQLWAAREGAAVVAAADLPGLPPPPRGAAIALDDADRLPAAAEEALLHLHNHLGTTEGRLMLTARRVPARWPVALPDLASRLQAMPLATLRDPDDHLLALLLARFMAERQILPAAGVIPYLVGRMERTSAAARRIAGALDAAALAEGRGVTRDLARAVLDKDEAGAR